MNKLLAFISILAVCLGCSQAPVEPEVITIYETDTLYTFTTDSFYTVITDTIYIDSQESQISVSPVAIGFRQNDTLFVIFVGRGVNVSDETVRNVSIEFTLTENADRTGILSNTIGYFLTATPPVTYVPNDPFPYEIQHDLSPGIAYSFYVGADPLTNIDGAYWYFRIIAGGELQKQAWQYGGEI